MGREDEQRTLDALVSGARVGRSGVLVLDGDAGIGKSALLAHAIGQATGFRLLRCLGTPAERDLPFAGLAHVLQPLLPAVDELPEPQARALGVALALRSDGVADRFAVSAAALTLVTRAAESGPLAVVIDDAHLLDASSAQALAFVATARARGLGPRPRAVRPGESDAWDDLPTLHVGPIASDAAERLADEAASGRADRRAAPPGRGRRCRQPAGHPGTRPGAGRARHPWSRTACGGAAGRRGGVRPADRGPRRRRGRGPARRGRHRRRPRRPSPGSARPPGCRSRGSVGPRSCAS